MSFYADVWFMNLCALSLVAELVNVITSMLLLVVTVTMARHIYIVNSH